MSQQVYAYTYIYIYIYIFKLKKNIYYNIFSFIKIASSCLDFSIRTIIEIRLINLKILILLKYFLLSIRDSPHILVYLI